jgi:hypothetical protein
VQKKYRLLLMGFIFDGVGILSFAIPFFGEFSDVVWAPLSAFIIYKMYGGILGKGVGIISFVEEIRIFGSDFLPTFTLTWIYKYPIKRGK